MSTNSQSAEQVISQLGRYEIIDEIGRGSMGVVYKAIDSALDRVIAIKTISLDIDKLKIEKAYSEVAFRREARIAANLNHRGIARIFDIGKSGDTQYFVMEYVKGETLSSILTGDMQLHLLQRLAIIINAAIALNYAHAHGVIHRDIRPENIIIKESGDPVIMDFGLAKFQQDFIHSHADKSYRIYGQPFYVSPEQISGKRLDHTSDIFSLGALAYQLLCGKIAFEATNLDEVFYKIENVDPPRPSEIDKTLPVELDAVINTSIAKNSENRYAHAIEFAKDLKLQRDRLKVSKIELWEQASESKDIIKYLKNQYTFFSNFTDLEIVELFNLSTKKDFPANSIIYTEGNVGTNMYIIMSGKVQIQRGRKPNKVLNLLLLKEGDCFGEMSLLDSGKRLATAVAIEDSSIIAISESALRMTRIDLSLKLHKNISQVVVKKFRQFIEEKYSNLE